VPASPSGTGVTPVTHLTHLDMRHLEPWRLPSNKQWLQLLFHLPGLKSLYLQGLTLRYSVQGLSSGFGNLDMQSMGGLTKLVLGVDRVAAMPAAWGVTAKVEQVKPQEVFDMSTCLPELREMVLVGFTSISPGGYAVGTA
jgi:hypothetical protein